MTIPGTLTGVDTAFWLDQYWTSIFRALVQSPRINSPAFYIWMHLKQAALMLLYFTSQTIQSLPKKKLYWFCVGLLNLRHHLIFRDQDSKYGEICRGLWLWGQCDSEQK